MRYTMEEKEMIDTKELELMRHQFECLKVWAECTGKEQLHDMLNGTQTIEDYLKGVIDRANDRIKRIDVLIETAKAGIADEKQLSARDIWQRGLDEGLDIISDQKDRIRFAESELMKLENESLPICVKCDKPIKDHPVDPEYGTIALFGAECAFNPDPAFEETVKETLARYEEIRKGSQV